MPIFPDGVGFCVVDGAQRVEPGRVGLSLFAASKAISALLFSMIRPRTISTHLAVALRGAAMLAPGSEAAILVQLSRAVWL